MNFQIFIGGNVPSDACDMLGGIYEKITIYHQKFLGG